MIDVATSTVVATSAVGDQPAFVAITPDGATAYVSNNGSDTVTPIDTATNTAGAPIAVDDQPGGLVVTPDGSTLYVAHLSGAVLPVDVATDAVGPNIFPVLVPGSFGEAIAPDQAPVAALSADPAPVTEATSFDASASTVTHGTIASPSRASLPAVTPGSP